MNANQQNILSFESKSGQHKQRSLFICVARRKAAKMQANAIEPLLVAFESTDAAHRHQTYARRIVGPRNYLGCAQLLSRTQTQRAAARAARVIFAVVFFFCRRSFDE